MHLQMVLDMTPTAPPGGVSPNFRKLKIPAYYSFK